MFTTKRTLLAVLLVTGIYWLGQALAHTDLIVATLFAIAVLFGILAVYAGGGMGSTLGCLNGVLIGKFLLIGVAIKILVRQSADGPLSAPRTTAWVMALGFIGLFLGTIIQSRVPCPQSFSLNRPLNNQMLLSLSIVLFVLTYAGYFASTGGDSVQTGGWVGIAHVLGSLKSLSIVPPMLYLWRLGTKRWMSHPLLIGMLSWSTVVGVFSTGKQETMEPMMLYVAVGFLRYGWRKAQLWALLSAGAAYYSIIVFPYSQYVRSAGGREGSIAERAEVTKDAFLQIATNQDFRSSVTEKVNQGVYFDSSLAAFNRLAMVGEADKLIFATEQQQAFTGWETIVWGFKLLMPSFLYHDKPVYGAGNFLSHIVGESNPKDTTTQVSYGIMANLYNAFSFVGVIAGTPLFFAAFYYWVRVFFGDPKCDGPTASTFWFLWLVTLYEHSIVESSLSGIIASLTMPVVVLVISLGAKWLCPFLPQMGTREILAHTY